jgi:putative transcription factor
MVEGAKMLVCSRCQKLGEPYKEEAPPPQRPTMSYVRVHPTPQRKPAELPKEVGELEVADNFSEIIRKRRMKLGLSQDELAKRISQKLSLIQKIETGSFVPDTRLCRLVEHELKVKLLVPLKEAELPKNPVQSEVTLGDIVKIKGKTKEPIPP